MITLSETSCTAVRSLLQTLELNQLSQEEEAPLHPSITAYTSMYAEKCEKEVRRYDAKQVTKDVVSELSNMITASFPVPGIVSLEDVVSLANSDRAVRRLTDIVRFHMACVRYKIDEDYSLKYYVCTEKTRKMYEGLLHNRCEEARAPYETAIAELKAEATELFRKLKVAEERSQRLEFVNRVQASRIDAYAVADAKSSNKIAALEEQVETVIRNWYNGNPVDAKLKIELLEAEQESLLTEIEDLKQFQTIATDGIKRYTELMAKAESSVQQPIDREDDGDTEQNGGPPCKRIRMDGDVEERDSLTDYCDAVEHLESSRLPQGSQVGRASSVKQCAEVGFRQRMFKCVVDRLTCSIA